MPLPFPVALAALLTIPGPPHLPESRLEGASLPAPETVLVIARPEKSDTFLSTRTRVSADDLLIRNPDLIRACREEDRPYNLRKVADQGWEALRQSELPVVQALNSPRPLAVPEPGSLALLSLSSLILLRRRRTFGEKRTDGHHPANHHWSVSKQ